VKQSSTFTAACALNDAEVILVKDPPEAACHSSPVAVALFATKPAILQEQSQRIVLSLIAGVLHPRLYLGGLVGLGAGLLW
jgi:hypothetical protein